MRRSRFPMKQQPATPVGDVAARHIVTDARTADSAQRGSEVSRLLLVRSGTQFQPEPGARAPGGAAARVLAGRRPRD
jgi:hypothetical protein